MGITGRKYDTGSLPVKRSCGQTVEPLTLRNPPPAKASRPVLASTTLLSAPEKPSGVPMLACLRGSRLEPSTELSDV